MIMPRVVSVVRSQLDASDLKALEMFSVTPRIVIVAIL